MEHKNLFPDDIVFKDYSIGGHSFHLPIRYRRLDTFAAVFGADYQKVKSLLPSPRLTPVRVWPGRAALELQAFNYIDTDVGPYGEFSVGVPCSLRHQGKLTLGLYVHRLPVTTDIARVAGIELYGYPKFISEMEFTNTSTEHSLKLSQDGEPILTFRVQKGRWGIGANFDIRTVTKKDHNLILTTISAQGVVRAVPHGMAAVSTGNHEMGQELASLALGDRPIGTADLLDFRMLLPEGENIGPV